MRPYELENQLRYYQEYMKEFYNKPYIDKNIEVHKINEAIPFYLDSSSFED